MNTLFHAVLVSTVAADSIAQRRNVWPNHRHQLKTLYSAEDT